MGPTGCGKTALAIKLVQRLPCEIISVDSAMVYRGMDIGSAKPTKSELTIAPHRLIDICDPSEPYSVARFCKDAVRAIKEIHANNKVPLLVGGTMLYFNSLLCGLSDLPAANCEIRALLLQELQTNGLESLYIKLYKIDPITAARIKPNDFQRIQRALEVYELTGKRMSELIKENARQKLPYRNIAIALLPQDRAKLAARLASRFKTMLQNDLIAEVETLHKRGDLTADLPAIRSVGYRQVWQYLSGELNYDAMVERSIIATKQLAKRQLTWLRSWPNLITFAAEDPKLLEQVLRLLENEFK